MTRRRTTLAVASAISLLGPMSAIAEQAHRDLAGTAYLGQFVRTENQFTCENKSSEQLSPEQTKAISEHACLRIGTLVIGSKATALRSSFGKPDQIIQKPDKTSIWVYLFGSANERGALAASVQLGKLVAIQVSGWAPADKYGFNGISLGATAQTVTDRLGKPISVKLTAEKGVERWSYHPWTFSFILTDDRVTSIRVADPKFD